MAAGGNAAGNDFCLLQELMESRPVRATRDNLRAIAQH